MLPGLFVDYLVLDTLGGAAPEKRGQRVPHLFVSSLIDTWLSSSFDAQTLHRIYEALGGDAPRGLSSLERKHHQERLRRSLVDAFQRGRLAAWEIRRAQPAPLKDDPKPDPEPKPNPEDETSFVGIQMVDEDGKAVPNVKYHLVLPDGTTRDGTLNPNGFARLDGIKPGTCKVSFPDLDGSAWSQ
jgi:hypothetical protein